MTLKQAIKIVESFNKWRRDDSIPNKTKMVNPTDLGIALDILIYVGKRYTKLYNTNGVKVTIKKANG